MRKDTRNKQVNIFLKILLAVAVVFSVPVFSFPAFAGNLTVKTNDVTGVNQGGAILNGFVSNLGGYSTIYFEWGESYLLNNTTGIAAISGSGVFRKSQYGLEQGKTYYYRAVAVSHETGETQYGQTLSFSTTKIQYPSQQIPTVETRTASNVTGSSAVLNGAVNPLGTSDTVRWFEWGTTQSLGKQTPKANQGTLAGNFNYSLSDLSPNTIYYFKAVAQNADGLAPGSIYSFKTGDINSITSTPSTGVTSITSASTTESFPSEIGGETNTTPPKTTKTSSSKATNTAMVGIFSDGFPNSLAGWLLIFLLIILIVIAIDHVVDRYQKRKEEKKRHELSVVSEREDGEDVSRVIK
ncbi:MAG: hypothetical protein Q7S11_03355 [bacterium]|nr:hypothetical protein [bacterium]